MAEEAMTEEEKLIRDTANKLSAAHNIVLHGAPGTGKTFLARQVAAKMMGWDGNSDNLESFLKEHQDQYGFVQFHPSYDYTDFVEGLRPVSKETSEVGFELRPGVFKEFITRAITSAIKLSHNQIVQTWKAVAEDTGENLERNWTETEKDKKSTNPSFTAPDGYIVYRKQVEKLINTGKYPNQPDTVKYNMVANAVKKKIPYVFIIDEVNRGDISKIFGELFFSIDPGYRGKSGKVLTQYDSMHPGEAIYVPENVYIICTMNDIDRSVESFDFAMRRRFRFIEIQPEETQYMLDDDTTKEFMGELNEKIKNNPSLGSAYQIGPSYFLSLADGRLKPDELWNDQLEPLIREYLRGNSPIGNSDFINECAKPFTQNEQ